jgi:hypothetical protein
MKEFCEVRAIVPRNKFCCVSRALLQKRFFVLPYWFWFFAPRDCCLGALFSEQHRSEYAGRLESIGFAKVQHIDIQFWIAVSVTGRDAIGNRQQLALVFQIIGELELLISNLKGSHERKELVLDEGVASCHGKSSSSAKRAPGVRNGRSACAV